MARTVLIALALTFPGLAEADEPKAVASELRLLEQPLADYVARRHALMERVAKAAGKDCVVIVRGEDDQGKEDFEEGRFRQRNDFAYLTGVDAPGAWLVLLPNQNRATLYLRRAGATR